MRFVLFAILVVELPFFLICILGFLGDLRRQHRHKQSLLLAASLTKMGCGSTKRLPEDHAFQAPYGASFRAVPE